MSIGNIKVGAVLVGLAATCIAGCTFPLTGTLLTLAGLAGIGTGALGWWPALVAIGGAIIAGVCCCIAEQPGQGAAPPPRIRAGVAECHRANARPMMESIMNSPETQPIACLLDANDFQERTHWIRDLTSRHLRRAERTPLSIHLSYALEAGPQVRELVSKEQCCCGFLRFELREEADAIHLVITAPGQAREAATMLFATFAPASGSAVPPTP